jgi:hypothetical protein
VYEIDPIFKNTKLDKSSHIDIRMIWFVTILIEKVKSLF